MGYRNYSVANSFTVDKLGNGDFTTIGAALSAAVSGQTIFIRPGTYTENLTLVAGVDLVSFDADAITGNVNVIGKATLSTAGVVTISGIRLTTNSDYAIVVSGSVNSLLFLENCYINCLHTGINFTSTGANATIQLSYCVLNTGTGAGLFSNTATQPMIMYYCTTSNTGASTTASTTSGSVAMSYCAISQPLSTSSAGGMTLSYCNVNTSSLNTTALTLAGTGTSMVEYSDFDSGTASALSIGAGTTLDVIGPCTVNSSNTDAITGSGTIDYTLITYTGSSSTNNVTTQTAYTTQPAFGGTSVVVQQVRAIKSAAQTCTTTIAAITTTPTTSTGTSIISVSITPTNSAHVLVIDANLVCTSAGNYVIAYIIQNAAGNAIASAWQSEAAANVPITIPLKYYMTAGGTSAITFALYVATESSGDTYVNANTSATQLSGGTAITALTVTEYTS